MTREEAIGRIENRADQAACAVKGDGGDNASLEAWLDYEAYCVALNALRGPVPDPETGLVPCGCGGKAVVEKSHRADMGITWVAWCYNCNSHTCNYDTSDRAVGVWNAAMGWRK